MSTKSRIRRTLRRTNARRIAATLAALSVLAPTAPQSASAEPAATTTSVATPSAPLPFDLPSTLSASPRKAFAHYVPWFPVSIDNKVPDYYDRNFLVPGGEGGKHAAYGGFLRDRPGDRPVSTDAAWKLRDLEAEVRTAAEAGLDGFIVDIVQLGDLGGVQWTAINSLLRAAETVAPGFEIVLMPDMTGPNMGGKDAPTLARWMAHLGKSPAAHRLPDGRLVVSPFTAERKTVEFWTSFLSIMRTTYGEEVAFLPLFQDERKWRTTFAPISWGMTNWGNRNPAWNNPAATGVDSPLGRAAAVKALGKVWMQPVSVQDERPREGIFDEALNTLNLRNTWQLARDSGAQLVQIPTWNDYAEGSQIAPSGENGSAWLDLNSYYLTWYKTGSAPQIVRDTVYLTHRGQPHAALPTYAQTLLMKRRGTSSSVPRDTVEALTFLTAPGTVRVTVGTATHTCQVDAGVDSCTVPVGTGAVSAVLERNSRPVTKVTSPRVVTSKPYVQDLQYVAVSSGRQDGAKEVVSSDAAPTTPSGLTVTDADATHSLSWTPSTDDYAVTGYQVHRSTTSGFTPSGSTLVGTTATPALAVPAGSAGRSYYRVVAVDSAGQLSGASSEVSALVADTQAPSAPAALTASTNGSTVAVTWRAASDDVGVRAYEVHRSATSGFTPSSSTQVASTAGTAHSETAPSGTWYYRVVAVDEAGNRSPVSPQAQAVVPAPATVVLVPALADTYANEGAPSTNFGTSSSMSSRGSLGAVSYLRFAVPKAPAGKTLRSAALQFRTTTQSIASSTNPHSVKVAGNSWTETGVTWRQRPAVTTQVLGTIPGGTAVDTTYRTALSTSAISSFGGTTRTLAVTSTGTDHLWFWSRNHANTGYQPKLVLTYQ